MNDRLQLIAAKLAGMNVSVEMVSTVKCDDAAGYTHVTLRHEAVREVLAELERQGYVIFPTAEQKTESVWFSLRAVCCELLIKAARCAAPQSYTPSVVLAVADEEKFGDGWRKRAAVR